MPKVVGVLGGGQLGRMMAQAAHRLGVKLIPLDPGGEESPAGQATAQSLKGSFRDPVKIKELSTMCSVITTEIEHVDTSALEELEEEGFKIEPSSKTIKMIQDKFAQKEHMRENGIEVGPYTEISGPEDVARAGREFGYPLMLKAKRMAYDGRGNEVVKSEEEAKEAYKRLKERLPQVKGQGEEEKMMYAEKWVEYTKELAVMVVRSESLGETRSYPVVEAEQLNSICHTTLFPPRGVSPDALRLASSIASRAVSSFSGSGIFGVELFLLPDSSVLLNEVAPRPHNTGHYTLDACTCDQFENHLRAVLGMPLGSTEVCVPVCMMVNLLGDGREEGPGSVSDLFHSAYSIPGACPHWYGKAEARKGRKMAHINFVAKSYEELSQRASSFLSEEARSSLGASPLVGIIMGSTSDLPTMKDAAHMLERFGVSYELTIVSAHRTPDRMVEYAKGAATRGLKCIIAGAGGAAHLPGMVAALTPLPVIGVPVKTSTLSGVDSLHSIVQMPRGVPVATVAIGNSTNAGLLAVRILASSNPSLLSAMDSFMKQQEKDVLDKVDELEKEGWKSYLDKQANQSTTVGI